MSVIVIFRNTILYFKCAFIVGLLNKRLLTWNLISFADCNTNQNTNKQLKFLLSLISKKNFSQIYCEFLGTESLISWSIRYLILSINLTYDKRKTAVAAFWLNNHIETMHSNLNCGLLYIISNMNLWVIFIW